LSWPEQQCSLVIPIFSTCQPAYLGKHPYSALQDMSSTAEADGAVANELPPTEMLYMTYEGNWLTNCQATVLQVQEEEDKVLVTLDKTCMHAQGGGQPTDKGVLQVGEEAALQVEKVTIDRSTGIATHKGHFLPDKCFTVGDSVQVDVDKNIRLVLSECHTAGHVVDAAMAKCGKLLKATKAYHFLEVSQFVFAV
jgi:Ser-tRNA(Ala) deacylase AlaX